MLRSFVYFVPLQSLDLRYIEDDLLIHFNAIVLFNVFLARRDFYSLLAGLLNSILNFLIVNAFFNPDIRVTDRDPVTLFEAYLLPSSASSGFQMHQETSLRNPCLCLALLNFLRHHFRKSRKSLFSSGFPSEVFATH